MGHVLAWIAVFAILGVEFALIGCAVWVVLPSSRPLGASFPAFGMIAGAALLLAALAAAWTWRRGWHRTVKFDRCWAVAGGGVILAMVALAFLAGSRVRLTSQRKAVESNLRQIETTVWVWVRESPYRIFFSRDEIIGPKGYIHGFHPVAGESYDGLFPIRRDSVEAIPLTTPDGREVLPAPATVPFLHGTVVMAWPHAARDAVPHRFADGVHTCVFSDGSRFEIPYRDGVPHGIFRAFLSDGTPWGETRYEHGRQTGPAWLLLPDGRKVDELVHGERAHAAFVSALATRRSQPSR